MSSSRRFRRRLEPPPQPGTWPPGDTKTTLVRDLEAKPADPVRDQIIKRAKAGHYHDFDTSLATPKVTLYKHLLSAGFPDLAQKVKDGAYDDERPTGVRRAHGRQAEGAGVKLDLSTRAGVLRFCELRRAEMVGCFHELGRYEVNGFSFGGYVFATHAMVVPKDPRGIDDWKTGAKLNRVTAERLSMPAGLHGVLPPERETEVFSFTARRYSKLTRAIGSVVMTEVWSVMTESREERDKFPERLGDYDGPERCEQLFMHLEHAATGERTWTALIERNPTRLGPWEERPFTASEGRLIDLAEWRS